MSIFVNEWAQDIFRVNRENYKIYFIWFRILFLMLLLMSLNRVVVFLSLAKSLPPFGIEQIYAYWMGMRFDALILGFTFLGIWLFGLIRFLFPNEITRHATIYLTKKYYLLVWILMSLVYYFNTWFVLAHKRHMRFADWQNVVELKTYMVFQNFPRETFFMVTGALILTFYLGARQILTQNDFFDIGIEKKESAPSFVSKSETLRELYAFRQNFSTVTPYGFQFLFYLLIPLLIGAFFARGTLTNHHLEIKHSQISNNSLMNELVLNPLWTFDKSLD